MYSGGVDYILFSRARNELAHVIDEYLRLETWILGPGAKSEDSELHQILGDKVFAK